MGAFEAMLSSVAARPAIYVGKTSLRAVSNYLCGYCHALTDAGLPDPLAGWGWLRWIELKYLISHPAWNWTRILLHIYGTDQTALDALPAPYEEFKAYISEIGRDNIDAEHYRRFVSAYGQQHHEPEATQTSRE